MQTLSIPGLYEKISTLTKNDLVLDVRTAEEFASGHVPGSRNIPFDEVSKHATELGRYKQLYLYCRSGGRVQKACHELEALGLKNLIAVVGGGMPDWEAAGYPVERA